MTSTIKFNEVPTDDYNAKYEVFIGGWKMGWLVSDGETWWFIDSLTGDETYFDDTRVSEFIEARAETIVMFRNVGYEKLELIK